MSGNFKVGKKIQITAVVLMVVCMPIGNYFWGYYGILGTVLFTSIVLAVLEVGFIHGVYFNKKISKFFKILLPNLLLFLILGYIEFAFAKQVDSVVKFIVAGCVLMVVNSGLGLLLNYMINRNLTVSIVRRVKALLIK